IEVLFKYSDQDEPTIYRDADVLKRIQLIDETLKRTLPNWATERIKLQTLMVMLWSKDTMEFCFNHAHRYTLPESSEERDLEEYKEANEKTLAELKAIAACATAMECSDSFCKALDFVIGEKLNGLPQENITMSVEIEVLIKYPDQDEPTIYRDADFLKRCPLIADTLKKAFPNWATEGIKLKQPMMMLWSKDTMEFCFNHAHRYTLPESPGAGP
ncbi:unnamed protein product, partial [Caenorhabditis brenneri]